MGDKKAIGISVAFGIVTLTILIFLATPFVSRSVCSLFLIPGTDPYSGIDVARPCPPVFGYPFWIGGITSPNDFSLNPKGTGLGFGGYVINAQTTASTSPIIAILIGDWAFWSLIFYSLIRVFWKRN
jgi:hypothetical protein